MLFILPRYFALRYVILSLEKRKMMMRFMKSTKAQITIEYLLLIVIVVTVLMVFLGKGGHYEKSLKSVFGAQGNRVIKVGTSIFF